MASTVVVPCDLVRLILLTTCTSTPDCHRPGGRSTCAGRSRRTTSLPSFTEQLSPALFRLWCGLNTAALHFPRSLVARCAQPRVARWWHGVYSHRCRVAVWRGPPKCHACLPISAPRCQAGGQSALPLVSTTTSTRAEVWIEADKRGPQQPHMFDGSEATIRFCCPCCFATARSFIYIRLCGPMWDAIPLSGTLRCSVLEHRGIPSACLADSQHVGRAHHEAAVQKPSRQGDPESKGAICNRTRL